MAAIPYRVKNTFVEPVPEDEEKTLQRSYSWSASSHSSQKLSSSDSTQAQFFSTSHAEQSLQGIINDISDSERDSATQTVPSEREQQAPVRSISQTYDHSAESVPSSSSERPPTQEAVITLAPAEEQGPHQAVLHKLNKCVPCAHFMMSKHCQFGSNCTFCHLSHEDRSLVRPTKDLRLRCKQTVTKVDTRYPDDVQAKLYAYQNLLSNQGHHIRNYTVKLLLDQDDDQPSTSAASQAKGKPAASSAAPLPVGPIVEGGADTISSMLPGRSRKTSADRAMLRPAAQDGTDTISSMLPGRSKKTRADRASSSGLLSRDSNASSGPVVPGLQSTERGPDESGGAVPRNAPKVVAPKIGKGHGKLSL